MAVTYGTSQIPGDEITVDSGNTVDISLGFTATVGLVGSYDSSNGSATAGDVVEVTSSRDARDKFGEDSELHRAVNQAYANGAVTVYAVPLPSTNDTESVSGTSGTLSHNPLFDPRVTTHDITVQDTTASSSEDVVITYESSPSTADTGEFKVNPITGDWADDGDGNNYDVTYDYVEGDIDGDGSTTADDTAYREAFEEIVDQDLRFLVALTENETIINEAATVAGNRADDFDFFRVVAGATPETSASSYSDTLDDRRVELVAPARAFEEQDGGGEFRLSAAVAGKQTGKQLGDSTTFETLSNIVDLNQKFTNSELGNWLDEDVTPVKQGDNIKIIKDRTTSTNGKFDRVYATEIVDEATEASHLISGNYIGELNTEANRRSLEDQHTITYRGFEENTPPLLDEFSVSVSENDTNADAVDVSIGLNVVDIIDRVNVDITVGDIITATQS